jgi:hypothetical protein
MRVCRGKNGARRALVAILFCSASPILAQTPPAAPAAPEGRRTYVAADFARFAPQNALDMLRNVPGFVIREASVERGLGTATGNVLVNGRRISGKSNDVITELSQIPAGNVLSIEILDAASLNIPGLAGQVANVIVKAGGVSGQWAWRPEFRLHNTDPLLTRGDVSVSGKTGPIEYTVGLQNQSSRSGAGGRTEIYGPDHEFLEHREEFWHSDVEYPKLSARFVYDGPGSSVGNLNLSAYRFFYDYREHGTRVGPGRIDRSRIVRNDQDEDGYEIGGDYEFKAGPGRLKLIGLYQFSHAPFAQLVRTSFADLSPASGSRFTQTGDSTERIVRGEYRWKGGGADWQLSGEYAFNALDNVNHLFLLGTAGDFQEIPLPGGTARVEEDRYETMASWGRPLSPKLRVQLSLGGEYSNLRQVGGGGLSRTFWRPKGLFSAAWKPSPKLDVSLKLQRRVGQLNFGDFLATVNLEIDRTNAGNVNLVPTQSWEGDLETTRNLGDYGTATLRLYGRLYDDIVDIIPIGLDGESPGNIDHAYAFGAEFKSTFNFDPMGWKGAKLDFRAQFQRSQVEDPLTHQQRPISSSLFHFFDVTLRHDIPGSNWAWGGNVFYERDALNYRLTEVGRQWEGPVWASLYVERKNVLGGLTVRATAGNILGATSMWDRTVYQGRRTGPIAQIEHRDRIIGPIFSFQVRGKF